MNKTICIPMILLLFATAVVHTARGQATVDSQRILEQLHALEADKGTPEPQKPAPAQGQGQTPTPTPPAPQKPTQQPPAPQKPTQSQTPMQQPSVPQKPTQTQTPMQQPPVPQKPTQVQTPMQQPSVPQKPTQTQTPMQQPPVPQKPTQTQTPMQQPPVPQKPTPTQTQLPPQPTGKVGTQWQIGMRWYVETTNIQSQQPDKSSQSTPVIWMFTVIAENRVENRDCFQVKVQCEDTATSQPIVYIWVDKQTGMLARMTTQVFIQDQWRTFTETYVNRSGQSTAVFGSIPSLPLDLPLFTSQPGSKDIGTGGMTYEIVQGNTGTKSLGEVGFAYNITQTFKPLSPEGSKNIEGSKALPTGSNLQNAIEVEMQGGTSGRVKQIWTPDTPWPVYSNNGSSEAKLLQVEYPHP